MGFRDGWQEELEVFLQQIEGNKERTAVLIDVFQADHQSPVEI